MTFSHAYEVNTRPHKNITSIKVMISCFYDIFLMRMQKLIYEFMQALMHACKHLNYSKLY